MRMWHKDLIKVLPRKQLIAQWRELCCIAKNISEHGTPNHILVNKVTDYSWIHFNTYANMVIQELIERGYKIQKKSYIEFCKNSSKARDYFNNRPDNCCIRTIKELYKDWHNDKYFLQCFYNLQEKYDCHGISEEEWNNVVDTFITRIKEQMEEEE